MTTNTTAPVTFRRQGGHTTDGIAIGRLGSQLLIQYRINDGSTRERWLKADRIITLHGNIDDLRRYKRVTLKQAAFEPVEATIVWTTRTLADGTSFEASQTVWPEGQEPDYRKQCPVCWVRLNPKITGTSNRNGWSTSETWVGYESHSHVLPA